MGKEQNVCAGISLNMTVRELNLRDMIEFQDI